MSGKGNEYPVLAGKYDAASGAWRGRWGMGSLEDFPPAEDTSEFEYARREPSGRVLGGTYDGHFMVKQATPDPPFQVVENGVVIEFIVEKRDTASAHIEVTGSGTNKFGNFALRGSFDPMTSELRVEKRYEAQKEKPKVVAGQITDAGRLTIPSPSSFISFQNSIHESSASLEYFSLKMSSNVLIDYCSSITTRRTTRGPGSRWARRCCV
jgi:hypothetical protein